MRDLEDSDVLATEPLHVIAELFAIEHASAGAHENANLRLARRPSEAPAILARLREWVDKYRGLIPPKTPLGKALGYLHRQGRRLILFLDDGRIELTNNQSERELRRLARPMRVTDGY